MTSSAPSARHIDTGTGLTRPPSTSTLPWCTTGVKSPGMARSEEHTSELQSPCNLVCRLLLENKNNSTPHPATTTHHPCPPHIPYPTSHTPPLDSELPANSNTTLHPVPDDRTATHRPHAILIR